MDTSHEKRVLELCLEAQTLPEQDQAAFLETATAGDPELLQDVQRLLGLVGKQDDFLEHSPVMRGTAFAEKERVGSEIGGFLVKELIGSGGMGSVYRAERLSADFEQQVALKIMDARLLTPHHKARFHDERKILANLSHPYIASLIDGGTTAQGVPYLVMEYVQGLPVDEYCTEHRLSVRDRLSLIEKITSAVQAAHTSLVVHRDLKPSNILVTADGNPKLLDFGIAKLIAEDRSTLGDSNLTLHGQLTLTPNYASPEQLQQGLITTRSDIYSLGLLAFVLLAGERPYDLQSVPVAQLYATLLKQSTRQASRVFGASDRKDALAWERQATPKQLRKSLAGELDLILAMAMHRDPERRYVSAAAMGADLRNLQRGLPVVARGDSTTYRFGKFIGRHRVATGAVGVATLATIVGISVALWQAQIAKQRFDDVHGLAKALMGEIYLSVESLPGSTPARVLITRETQRYLDRLATTATGDDGLSYDLAVAYQRMGDVLGLPTNANLGDTLGAKDNYEQALEILTRLDANDLEIANTKGRLLQKRADLFAWEGEMDLAKDSMEQAYAIFQGQLVAFPNDVKVKFDVARNHIKRGDLFGHPNFPNMANPDGALDEYQQARELLEPLATAANATWQNRRYFALTNERIGTMFATLGDHPQALTFYLASKLLREALAGEQPQNYDARRDVGIAVEKMADVRLAQGQPLKAIDGYGQSLAIYQSLLRLDKENTNAQRTVAVGLENLAGAEVAAVELSAARGHLQQARALWVDLLVLDPNNTNLQDNLSRVEALVRSLEVP